MGSLPTPDLLLKGKYVDDQILLSWENKNQTFQSFVVERAASGYYFESIGTVNTLQNPSFYDKHPFAGANQYRLQMVDKDGKIQYSNIVELNTQSGDLSSKIYPNPSWDYFQVECYTKSDTETQLWVTDQLGKTVYLKNQPAQVGKNIWTIPAENWEKGVYILQIRQGTKDIVQKIIKL